MNQQEGDSEHAETDDKGADSPFGRFTYYVLGVATAVCLWAIISFAVPIIDTSIPGLWPFPLPEGKTSYGELALVVITIVYVWASVRQWWIARRALDITRSSLQLSIKSQRAWLFIDNIGALNFVQGEDPVVGIHVRNVGILPATNARTRLSVGIFAKEALVFFGGELPEIPGVTPTLPVDGHALFGRNQVHRLESTIHIPMPNPIQEYITHGAWIIRLRIDIAYTDPLKTEGSTSATADYIYSAHRWAWRSGTAT